MSLDAVPDFQIVEKRHAFLNHIRIVRLILQSVMIKSPELLKRLVEQLEASVTAEHGNCFMQIVQRRRLRFHDGVEFCLEVQLAGNVLEQKKQAAHRVALARDGQCAVIRKRPGVFLHAINIEIIGQLFSAPFGIIRPSRQFAAFTQTVQ